MPPEPPVDRRATAAAGARAAGAARRWNRRSRRSRRCAPSRRFRRLLLLPPVRPTGAAARATAGRAAADRRCDPPVLPPLPPLPPGPVSAAGVHPNSAMHPVRTNSFSGLGVSMGMTSVVTSGTRGHSGKAPPAGSRPESAASTSSPVSRDCVATTSGRRVGGSRCAAKGVGGRAPIGRPLTCREGARTHGSTVRSSHSAGLVVVAVVDGVRVRRSGDRIPSSDAAAHRGHRGGRRATGGSTGGGAGGGTGGRGRQHRVGRRRIRQPGRLVGGARPTAAAVAAGGMPAVAVAGGTPVVAAAGAMPVAVAAIDPMRACARMPWWRWRRPA